MKRIEYCTPQELSEIPNVDVKVAPIPGNSGINSALARELWAFSKRRIITRNGKTLLRSSDTITGSFARKIEEFLSDTNHLNEHFGGKRPTDAQMAKRADFSIAKWNRLTGGTHLDLERGNAFAVAIALELDENQITELLYSGGFILNYELELDCVVMYFVSKKIYDIKLINETLTEFCNVKNGLDKFTFNPKK